MFTFVSVHGLVEVHHACVSVALLVLVLPVLGVVLLIVGRDLLLLLVLTRPSLGVAGHGGQGGFRLDWDNLLDVRVILDRRDGRGRPGPLDGERGG